MAKGALNIIEAQMMVSKRFYVGKCFIAFFACPGGSAFFLLDWVLLVNRFSKISSMSISWSDESPSEYLLCGLLSFFGCIRDW